MTDPEILDAEPTGPRAGGQGASGPLEPLLAALHKALPGRVVRVEGNTVCVAGKADGDVTVQLTPLFALVGFRGARMPVMPAQDPAQLAAAIAAKVARLATDELVVFEQQETAGLLRTVVVAVAQGALESVIDEGQLPSQEPARPARFYSCQGTFSHAPSRDEEKWIARHTGGLAGKLRRKIVAKVFKKVGSTLESAVQARMDELRPELPTDDGRRTLGPKG